MGKVCLSHHQCDAVRSCSQVASQEQTNRGAFGRLAERISTHIEIVHARRGEYGVAAVAVSKPPNATPALQRAQGTSQNPAYAAELTGSRVVVFGDSKGFVEQTRESDWAATWRALGERTGIGATARQAPGGLKKPWMIDIEMVIDVIIDRARALIGGESGPGTGVADQCP